MGRDEKTTSPLLNIQSNYSSASAPPYEAHPSYNTNSDYDPYADVPPELVDSYKQVRQEFEKVGIKNGHKARVCLLLDISSSMQNPNQFFRDTFRKQPGPIHELLKKVLSVAMAIDDNMELEIFAFGKTCLGPFTATADNFQDVILRDILRNDPKNNLQLDTNYTPGLSAVRKYYFDDDGYANTKAYAPTPVFVIMVTDGETETQKQEAEAQFRASSYQPVFFKVIPLKGKGNPDFKFLQDRDDAPTLENPSGRLERECNFIDNVDVVDPIDNPAQLTVTDLLREYPGWVLESYKHGLITVNPQIDEKIVARNAANEGRIEKRSCCILI